MINSQTLSAEKRIGSVSIWMILFFGASLRVFNLLSNKALWGDELFSVLLARQSFWDTLYGAISDVHPPGHLILLHAFYAVLGDHDWVYRLPSVLTGCALVGIVYLFGRELFKKSSALLAAFFVAISPYFIQLSNEVRSYSLTTFAMTFASYSFVKSFRTSEPKWRRVYEISIILCTYINHFAWVWLFMVNIFLLLNRAFKSYFKTHLRILFYGLPALLLSTYQVLFSRSNLATDLQVVHQQKTFSLFQILKKIFGVLWHSTTGYGYSGLSKESFISGSSDPVFWLALITFGSFLTAVIYTIIKTQKDISLFVLLSSIVPMVLLCLLYPTRLESRYVGFLMPPLFIFAAVGFSRSKFSLIGALLFVTLSLYLTFKTIVMPWDPIHREDYRNAIDYTFRVANEKDAVCGLDRYVKYYGPQETRIHHYPYIDEINFQENYAKIFLLTPSLYTDPKLDHKRLDSAKVEFRKFGYTLTQSIDFGEDGVYTFVHVFEKS